MNPQCARCGKIVYPTEKVSCLDKNWHKGCFHCEVCKMTLNMKNYKGYDKKPYCNAHYPKTTFTIVTDTPENLRLRQQSELQSQVRYKKDFEESKGRGFSIVSDTPEMQRLRRTQEQISNVKYREEYERSRGPEFGEGLQCRSDSRTGETYHQGVHQQQQHFQSTSLELYEQDQENKGSHVEPLPLVLQRVYRALYDYAAQDHDEVSFRDGDVIVNAQAIDEGWMYGTVQRTGKSGMLPANYVEFCN
ncbi:LIM and SH3 domain protein 1-like isoform X4 [Anarhichas minor]|uniref:LIM and SH3 domain protein 1-like isoform X4 n=1 Tax=Anarhichas minor TaxID=65739 RepID=UPI003F73C3D3